MKFADERTAQAVSNALLPDNVSVPRGMILNQKQKGKQLFIDVMIEEVTRNPIETLISTLDEFLSHIQTSVQSIERIELKHD